jgi:hypothetical protein
MNFKATVAIAFLGIAVLAGAQEKPLGLSARVGPFFPLSPDAQTAGNTWFGAGLDFKIHDLTQDEKWGTSSIALSLDYTYRQDFRSLPVLVNYVVRKGELYYLAGVGVNFTRDPNLSSSSQTKFAYDLGVGYDILKNGGTPIFVEARYFGNQYATFNGIGAYVGVRL